MIGKIHAAFLRWKADCAIEEYANALMVGADSKYLKQLDDQANDYLVRANEVEVSSWSVRDFVVIASLIAFVLWGIYG